MKTKNKLFWKIFIAGLLALMVQSCGLVNSEDETKVIITVRDFNSQQLIQGGTVRLYKTANDWTYSQNAYRVTNTDANGQATFTGVDAGVDYYFDAEQAGKNNYSSNYHLGTPTKNRQTSYASTYIQ